MTILRRIILLAALGVAPFVANRPRSCHAAETNDLPHFQELFRLLRANLPEASDEELNRAAVKGLTSALAPKVSLVPKGAGSTTQSESALVTRSNLFDGKVAYVRIGRVEEDLAKAILSQIREDEIVAMCCDVVNIPSPTGEELEMSSFMLIEYPVGCWYCEMPEVTGIVLVELPAGKSATFTRPSLFSDAL